MPTQRRSACASVRCVPSKRPCIEILWVLVSAYVSPRLASGTADGDRLGKTIIFAKNQGHAAFIADRFNANYPHFKGEFARVITFKTEYAPSLIDTFSIKDRAPHIAISVDMLDTGIDVPEVVNLVFFKLVRSKTKFWQMIGRGTRLCPSTAHLLHHEVEAMNLENFVVRPKRRLVEKYAEAEAWVTLPADARAELAHEVAGLRSELDPENEEAKRFDLLLRNLQLAVLEHEPSFERLRNQVMEIAARSARRTRSRWSTRRCRCCSICRPTNGDRT